MRVKGIIFDVNGTLSDIHTDEGHDEVYRVLSNLLSYQGIMLEPHVVKDLYYQIMKEQRVSRGGRHPEFDASGIFHTIITRHGTTFTRGLPTQKLKQLPRLLAETYRAVSRFRLQPYPGVLDTIRQLHQHYPLAIVSDAQTAYGIPELNTVGLARYFDPIIISGDFGVRKPHECLFLAALRAMKMKSSEVLFVGNNLYRDVYGAKRVGMTTVFCQFNHVDEEQDQATPDYIIYQFPELLKAIRFFEDQ